MDEQPNVAVTLASYEANVEAYLHDADREPRPTYSTYLNRVVENVPSGARMLELGTGPGHDAIFFEQRGIRVHRTDATQAFIDRLNAAGYEAVRLDVTVDEFGGPFDVVFANAVLLHLSTSQFDCVLSKAAQSVLPNGLFAFTLKEGDGDAWSNAKLDAPRYFRYWREPELHTHLAAAGWTPLTVEQVQGRTADWLYVICRRQ